MAIKLKPLVLAALLTLSSVAQVTAKHDTASYKVPHDVANYIYDKELFAEPVNYTQTPGCDDVGIFAMYNEDRSLAGYMLLANDSKTNKDRLVSIEMFNMFQNKVFGWINEEDYLSLKECHFGEPK